MPGPAYVDDTVAVRRDLDLPRNGIQSDDVFYYLTDQQYSTVALLDAGGNVVERYGYDAFGTPTIHNAEATATLVQRAVGNTRLCTGRDYLPALGLYDYRQRLYDRAAGRFVTTDPIGNFGEPNNLGNRYTYVGNNPGAFVDPYGDARETVWDAASVGLGAASFGYNLSHGNYLSAGIDAVGVVLDGVAATVAFVPGGAGLAIKAYRGTDIAFNGGQSIASGIDAGITASEGDYTGAALAATGAALKGAHAGVRVGQVGSAARAVEAEPDHWL